MSHMAIVRWAWSSALATPTTSSADATSHDIRWTFTSDWLLVVGVDFWEVAVISCEMGVAAGKDFDRAVNSLSLVNE